MFTRNFGYTRIMWWIFHVEGTMLLYLIHTQDVRVHGNLDSSLIIT